MARLTRKQVAAIITEYETYTDGGKDELMRYLTDNELKAPSYLWDTQEELDNAKKNFAETAWTLQENDQIVIS